jgi:hypothetical protein
MRKREKDVTSLYTSLFGKDFSVALGAENYYKFITHIIMLITLYYIFNSKLY